MTTAKKRKHSSKAKPPLSHSILAVSNRRLTVCGCKRIEKYSSEEILLLLRECRSRISGEMLTLGFSCGDELEIRGLIASISFE